MGPVEIDLAICVPSDSSTSTLFIIQLEAGPGSRGKRRVHSELEPAVGPAVST